MHIIFKFYWKRGWIEASNGVASPHSSSYKNYENICNQTRKMGVLRKGVKVIWYLYLFENTYYENYYIKW